MGKEIEPCSNCIAPNPDIETQSANMAITDDGVCTEETYYTEQTDDQRTISINISACDSGSDADTADSPVRESTEQIQDNTNVGNSPTPCVAEYASPTFPTLPLPGPVSDYRNCISAFGFSQQGESHIKKGAPCQDRSDLRFITDSVVIAAVADGVGSCELSDYGADAAVKSSLDYLEKHLAPMLSNTTLRDLPMGDILRAMMRHAYDNVCSKAAEMQQDVYSLQSTLTVAVFDGGTIYFAHAGDDGIVAVTRSGQYEMATVRHKGEEASSVYPLQSIDTWDFGRVDDAIGFIMATDGVLDAFVRNQFEGNRVYYPFIEPVFSNPPSSQELVAAACCEWYEYMKAPSYRDLVTDDLSFICIINKDAVSKAKKPSFDKDDWERQSAEFAMRRRAILYPDNNQDERTISVRSQDGKNTSCSIKNSPFSQRTNSVEIGQNSNRADSLSVRTDNEASTNASHKDQVSLNDIDTCPPVTQSSGDKSPAERFHEGSRMLKDGIKGLGCMISAGGEIIIDFLGNTFGGRSELSDTTNVAQDSDDIQNNQCSPGNKSAD